MSRKARLAQIEQRRKIVAANLLAGNNYRRIAESLGVSLGTVAKDVSILIKQWESANVEIIDDWKTMSIERLNRMLLAVWEKASSGDKDAIEIALKLEKRMSEIVGYNAPTRTEHTGDDGGAIIVTLKNATES